MSTPTLETKRVALGGAVRQIRVRSKWTQAEVATKAGIHFAIVSMVEHNKRRPSLDVLQRIAAALECDLDDITYEVAA